MPKKYAPNNKRAREENNIGIMTRSKRRKLDETYKNDVVMLKKSTNADIKNAYRSTKVKERKKSSAEIVATQSEKVHQTRKNRPNDEIETNEIRRMKNVRIVLKRLTNADIENACHSTKVKERKKSSAEIVATQRRKIDRKIKSTVKSNSLDVTSKGTPTQTTEISANTSKGSTDEIIPQISETLTVAKPEFAVNEIIWAKLKGFCHWPARIDKVIRTHSGSTMYEVIWYNDNRRSKMYKLQVFKFLENFEQFAKKFDDVIGLKTAAYEAMYTYRQNNFGK